jgi:hypothetical protein
MSGSRRTQRSVRVLSAVVLVVLGAAAVAVAVAVDTALTAAAVGAAVIGLAAIRIMYSEVVATRRASARERALQAQSFGDAMAKTQVEHAAFTKFVTRKISQRERTIRELNGTVRLAEVRADEAEARVKREARRANEAAARLSELVDEVLSHQAAVEAAHMPGDELIDSTDLPTIVDLLAWEDRLNESLVEDLRKEA